MRTRPWFDSQYSPYSQRTRGAREDLARELGASETEQAGIDIQVLDCNGAAAGDIALELWTVDGQGALTRCRACSLRYRNDDGSALDRARETTSRRGSAYAFAPPGQLTVVARTRKMKQVLAILHGLTVEAGTEYNLLLYPASRSQLSRVPPEVR